MLGGNSLGCLFFLYKIEEVKTFYGLKVEGIMKVYKL